MTELEGSQTEMPETGSAMDARGAEGAPQIDDLKLQMLRDRLRGEQSLSAGLAAGLAAALLGATLWAVVTVLTGYQIGWMAVGIGFLVGISVRRWGKGIETGFALMGALLSLAGCLAGNLLSIYGFASKELGVPLTEVIGRLEVGVLLDILVASFSPIDLLFYGIALYEGWKLSKRQLTHAELEQLLAETG